jgi:hypothetical protein
MDALMTLLYWLQFLTDPDAIAAVLVAIAMLLAVLSGLGGLISWT